MQTDAAGKYTSLQDDSLPMFQSFTVTAATLADNPVLRKLGKTERAVGFFCLKGGISLHINDEAAEMKTCDLCTFWSKEILRVDGYTPDFEGYLFIVAPYFFANVDSHISITYFLHRQVSPVVSLPDSELPTLYGLFKLMARHAEQKGRPYHREIMREIVLIALYEICAIYETQNRTVRPAQTRLRDKELLREFLRLVEENFKQERSLDFYAQKLCLTPKYLSSAIKRLSGSSGAEWINFILLQNAKSILYNSQMTIQQVSDYLNFPNASFFGKYFKKHTGMTPREFKTRQKK